MLFLSKSVRSDRLRAPKRLDAAVSAIHIAGGTGHESNWRFPVDQPSGYSQLVVRDGWGSGPQVCR
jgi:hypothetical protein